MLYRLFNLVFVLISCCFQNALSAQDIFAGMGFEINQTRFRLDEASFQALTGNPHKADIGISGHVFVTTIFGGKYLINLKPGLSILRTKSEQSFKNRMKFFTWGVEFGYCLSNFRIIGGAEYSFLDKLITSFSSADVDFTEDANHRHFISPTFSLVYLIDKNWSTQFKCVYYAKNVFNSGAFDVDGTIVSPVLVTPWTIALGVNYSFHINK